MRTLAIAILLFITGSFTTMNQREVVHSKYDTAIWKKIGEMKVNFELEREEFIPKGRNQFTALKFVIKKAPVEISKMEIYFTNGDKQNVVIEEDISSQGESQAIQLNGGERQIAKVVFEYKTHPNEEQVRAGVELWGMIGNNLSD